MNCPILETSQCGDSCVYTESTRACDKQVVAVFSVIPVPQAVTRQRLLQRLQLKPSLLSSLQPPG